MLDCPDLAVPLEIMRHVVHVESARQPFAIGVVGGRLSRQPRNLDEALAAVRLLKEEGYNFSVGIAQVNRYNLARYGLASYAEAFEVCPNLRAGAEILKECHDRAKDWGKAFSCYYSGNFVTGFQHGYVQKVLDSMAKSNESDPKRADIAVIPRAGQAPRTPAKEDGVPLTHQSASIVRASPSSVAAVPAVSAHPGPNSATEPARKPAANATTNAAAKPASALSDIPTQLVGSSANPYQVQVLPVQKSGATAASARLPSPSRRSDVAGSAVRGGSLLESQPPSSPEGGSAPAASSDAAPVNGDRSFVF